jgi:hypothetical protein
MTSEAKNLSDIDRPQPDDALVRPWSDTFAARCEVPMSAVVTAAVIGTALLVLAIWIERRERVGAPGDGNYRNSGPPRS